MKRPCRPALAFVLALAWCPAARAQVAEKHPAHGLVLSRPAEYEPLPVRPSELERFLAYRGPQPPSGEPAPTLDVYQLGEGLEAFVAGLAGDEGFEEVRAGRGRYGYQARRWEGAARDGRRLFVHAWIGSSRSVVLVGQAAPAWFARERRTFESVLASMRLSDPRDPAAERARIERPYESGRWSGVAHRVAVRLALLEGWSARDTEHFIVISHAVDEAFLRELCDDVEAARAQFARLFPPEGTSDTVSTVRICRDAEEFYAYGGPPGALGYWSPREGELVLYDARSGSPGDESGERFTQAVFLHESLHQYLHEALNGVPPDPWIDEGLAEYFAATDVSGGQARGIELNPWRLPGAQQAVAHGHDWPWQQVVELDQASFYAAAAGLYAQAWSMVHFLAASEAAAADARWRAILPTYLATLRSTWAREEQRAAAGPDEWERAVGRCRRAAREAAFAGVDWDELQQAWRTHVRGLPALPGAR